MKQTLLAQGAEAKIYKIDNTIKKIRSPKSYRHPFIDNKLRKSRTKSEGKIMQKLYEHIAVPRVQKVDNEKKEIDMEYIDGKKLSMNFENQNIQKISKLIGQAITKMHDQNIIHGDLTTSNMIISNQDSRRAGGRDKKHKVNEITKGKEDTLYLIDFGLAFHSSKIEDKAVDLHVLKQALQAKHHTIADQCMKIILQNYKPPQSEKILTQLKKVESRGRYKDRY